MTLSVVSSYSGLRWSPADWISSNPGYTAIKNHASCILQLNVEGMSAAKHIISSRAKHWSDTMPPTTLGSNADCPNLLLPGSEMWQCKYLRNNTKTRSALLFHYVNW